MKNEKLITVSIVDDIPLFRDGVKALLKPFTEIKIIGEADNGKVFIKQLDIKKPDVVLLDLEMPEMDGFETTEFLKMNYPEIRIVILTMHNSMEYIKYLLTHGAHGFLLKNSKTNEIVDAIDSVMDIGYYFNDKVSQKSIKHLYNSKIIRPSFKNVVLSDREIEILSLVSAELSNKEIAEKLFIDVTTVETHKKNIIKKTSSKNIIGAVLFGLKYNLF